MAVTAGDLILYGRERIYKAIEHDCYRFADIVFGQTLPSLGALCVHRHRNVCISAELREVSTRVGDHVTFERCTTVTLRLERYELIVSVSLVDSLHCPVETCVTRQNGFRNLRVQHCVDFSGIYIVNSTYDRTAVCLTGLVDRRVKNSEEWVVLLVLSYLSGLISLNCSSGVAEQLCEFITFCLRSLFGFYFFSLYLLCLLRGRSSKLTVDLCQQRQQLGSLIGLPELKVRRTLEQFTNTLRLFDTRKFNQDTTRLSQFLNVRLNNTETVDTCTEHVKGVLNSSINFLANNFFYLSVCRSEGYFVFEFKS